MYGSRTRTPPVVIARVQLVALSLVTLCSHTSCSTAPIQSVDNPRGNVNGASFELISNRDEKGEWNVRIRGDVMWVAFSDGEETRELGKFKLAEEESETVWEMVQEMDYPESDPDALEGVAESLIYRYRVPGEANYTATMAREDALKNALTRDLLKYLRTLIETHAGEKPRL